MKWWLPSIVLLISTHISHAAPSVTFSDGTFRNADWSNAVIVQYNYGVDPDPTYMVTQVETGGFPDEYRLTELTGGDRSYIALAHLHNGAVYDPSSQGSIGNVSYEFLLRIEPDHSPEINAVIGALLVQDGFYYRTGAVGVQWPDWTYVWSHSYPHSESDFYLIDPGQGGPLHPDFSSNGGPIRFGYFSELSLSLWFNGTLTSRSGIDNWSVRVTPPFEFSPANPGYTQLITFDASASTLGGFPIVSYEWDFGDGRTGEGQTIERAYTAAGTYTVTLTVTDSNRGTSVASEVVTVADQCVGTPVYGVIYLDDPTGCVAESPERALTNTIWGEFPRTGKLQFNSRVFNTTSNSFENEQLSTICDGSYKLLYEGRELNCQGLPGERCVVGKCPWEGGCNVKWFYHTGDKIDGNGDPVPDEKPDCLIRTEWISKDYSLNDPINPDTEPWLTPNPNPDALDWAFWFFNTDQHAPPITRDARYPYLWGPPVGDETQQWQPDPINDPDTILLGPQIACAGLWEILGQTTRPEGTILEVVDVQVASLAAASLWPREGVLAGETSPPFPMVEGPMKLCDLNDDSICDGADVALFDTINGSCFGSTSYNPVADLNASDCIDNEDRLLLFEQDNDVDTVPDVGDNCIHAYNPDQRDTDGDGFGNICDPDLDNNLIVNAADLAIFKPLFFSTETNADFDGDGVVNAADLAILKTMFFKPPGPSCCAL